MHVALRAAVFVCAAAPAESGVPERPPNFIVILCDNLGYGDVGCFGSKLHRTPHIDRLAQEGVRFTDFYVSSGVCTPSRASLMTGCYPRRVNMHQGAKGGRVLFPVDERGLHPEEETIAEILKTRGYATVCIGKWHLGDQAAFLPTRQGFDHYLGIPYSDDMTERKERGWPPLPLLRGEKVIEAPVDRNLLTKRYTEEAVAFIKKNRARPFFLYLPHAMPGSTKKPYASARFRGKSKNGAWGDSVEEIDWSTGEIVAALKKLDLDKNTLVVWTSDNGAPRRQPVQGSNLPLAGWGYTTAEGGMRVPCVMRWTGRIPAGKTCTQLATTMDLLPTFAHLAGAKLPKRRIDGKDISKMLTEPEQAKTPHEALYYYEKDRLEAVRSGPWKLYLLPKPRLFNLVDDLREREDQAGKRPDVVKKLRALAAKARADLGDGNQPGKNQRPAGHEKNPIPNLKDR